MYIVTISFFLFEKKKLTYMNFENFDLNFWIGGLKYEKDLGILLIVIHF